MRRMKRGVRKTEVKLIKQMLATKEDIAKLEGRLEVKISESKADTLKWVFIFLMGQLAAIIGIVKLFFGNYRYERTGKNVLLMKKMYYYIVL